MSQSVFTEGAVMSLEPRVPAGCESNLTFLFYVLLKDIKFAFKLAKNILKVD